MAYTHSTLPRGVTRPLNFGTKRNVLADNERRSGGTLFIVIGPSGSGKTTLIDMAADVFKECKVYNFVQNYATAKFPAPGSSKRDIDISKDELTQKKANGEVGHLWSVQGEDFALPPSKVLAELLTKNVNVVVDVPDGAVGSLLIGDLFFAKVAWLCLGGFRDHPEGFKPPTTPGSSTTRAR